MSTSNFSVIIPFSQNFTTTVPVSWKYVGLGDSVPLYLYDSNNNARKWSLRLLQGSVENEPADGATQTLKYLNKTAESYNLTSFFCETIKVTLQHELNYYYRLENLYIAGTLQKKFTSDEIEENSYYFHINSNLNIASASIDNSFVFTLKYRETEDVNTSQIEVRHDPRYTELIKLSLNGYNLTYNELKLANTTVDYREYSKRIYFRDGPETGYLRYDKIKERFGFATSGSTAYTMFEFNIVDSSLYNILVEGSDSGNKVTVPELRIKGGKFVASIRNSDLLSNDETVVIEYCELYLYDSELEKVPLRSNILRITKPLTTYVP